MNRFEERAKQIRDLLELHGKDLLERYSRELGVVIPSELLPNFVESFCDLTELSIEEQSRSLIKVYGVVRLIWPEGASIETVRRALSEASKEARERVARR